MTTLPVLRSIFSPQALLPLLETTYGNKIARLQLIKAVISDTYRVLTADGNQTILRIYPGRRRTLQEIEAELDFLQFLHEGGIPVSIPIETLAATRILPMQAPEGERYAVMFTYAVGQPLRDDPADARRFGALLAQLHETADKLPQTLARAPLNLDFLLGRPLAQLNAHGQRPHDWAYLQQLAVIIRSLISELPGSPPTVGYCHGDVCKANAHVNADGAITFFDFDFCGLGWRVYDVATLISGESDEVTAAFLAGYQSVRALADAELDAIPLFQIAQRIWLLGTRADYINEWGEIRLTRRFVNNVLDEIRHLADGCDLLHSAAKPTI